VPQPIEVKLYGGDLPALENTARAVARAIADVRGVVDVRDGINPAGDAVEIHVDRVKAALEGLDPDAVTRELTAHLTGLVTTQIPTAQKMIGVRVWTPLDQRDRIAALDGIRMRAPDGHPVPLRRVVSIERKSGQPQLVRENFKQMFAVTGRISGRDIGSTTVDVRTILDRNGLLPAGVYYELGGLYKEQRTAFRGLAIVFASAVVLVFLLLLFMYERFTIALAILLMPLLSLAAVFIGLRLAHVELNISSMMGMTMIVGIVTEVAIFYFSEYESIRRDGDKNERDILVEAGLSRMRPIAMTTFAAILALLPLAFAWGEGAAMQQPLAVAIASGLLVQLPLVLLVMPVVFTVLQRFASVTPFRRIPK
jgi:multidrug efflux pump subunit AcrB